MGPTCVFPKGVAYERRCGILLFGNTGWLHNRPIALLIADVLSRLRDDKAPHRFTIGRVRASGCFQRIHAIPQGVMEVGDAHALRRSLHDCSSGYSKQTFDCAPLLLGPQIVGICFVLDVLPLGRAACTPCRGHAR